MLRAGVSSVLVAPAIFLEIFPRLAAESTPRCTYARPLSRFSCQLLRHAASWCCHDHCPSGALRAMASTAGRAREQHCKVRTREASTERPVQSIRQAVTDTKRSQAWTRPNDHSLANSLYRTAPQCGKVEGKKNGVFISYSRYFSHGHTAHESCAHEDSKTAANIFHRLPTQSGQKDIAQADSSPRLSARYQSTILENEVIAENAPVSHLLGLHASPRTKTRWRCRRPWSPRLSRLPIPP